MKKIYFVRHGETDWNKEGKLQGQKNISLNEIGKLQAENTAKFLDKYTIDYVFSSNLDRAFETAKIIANSKDVGLEKVNNLGEISFGVLEGQNKEVLSEIAGTDYYKAIFHTDTFEDYRFEGGDTKKEARERFEKAVLKILNETEYENIMIVSHGFVLKSFLANIGMNFEKGLANCAIVYCEYDGETFKNLKLLNEN